jgi:hypothetical protein
MGIDKHALHGPPTDAGADESHDSRTASRSASGRVRAFRSRTVPNMQPVGPNALPAQVRAGCYFRGGRGVKAAISGFLGRGRRGPARPAADVYCKDGPPGAKRG